MGAYTIAFSQLWRLCTVFLVCLLAFLTTLPDWVSTPTPGAPPPSPTHSSVADPVSGAARCHPKRSACAARWSARFTCFVHTEVRAAPQPLRVPLAPRRLWSASPGSRAGQRPFDTTALFPPLITLAAARPPDLARPAVASPLSSGGRRSVAHTPRHRSHVHGAPSPSPS